MITTTCWILWIPWAAGVPTASADVLAKGAAAITASREAAAQLIRRRRVVTIDMNTLQAVSCEGDRSHVATRASSNNLTAVKAVILAGGFGSRLSEETAVRPKP